MVRSMEWVRSPLSPDLRNVKGVADEDRDATPSFALLDVQGPVIVTYVYQLVDGEVCSTFIHPHMLLTLLHSPLLTILIPNCLPHRSLSVQRSPVVALRPSYTMSFDEAHHDGSQQCSPTELYRSMKSVTTVTFPGPCSIYYFSTSPLREKVLTCSRSESTKSSTEDQIYPKTRRLLFQNPRFLLDGRWEEGCEEGYDTYIYCRLRCHF